MLMLKIIDNNSTSCFCFTLFVEATVITDGKYLCNNTQTNPTIFKKVDFCNFLK